MLVGGDVGRVIVSGSVSGVWVCRLEQRGDAGVLAQVKALWLVLAESNNSYEHRFRRHGTAL